LRNGKVNVPNRLAVNGFVFVTDVINHRIVMLGPSLNYIRDIVSGLRYPLTMCFDELSGRLYVADNKRADGVYTSGQVKVYSVTI